ncbi:uncharacterized protein BO96DRAFT_349399 [Aspergillus niger CBS 101883]|uniref:Uncharacterized protein n=2 Tax=Aspergillus niger TaxID=5061 RepID=A2R6A2_ASPNC|nr:uncharacterized protein BO96DRAFT_349399 [Aspergillus niger CBS 101883]XP_059605576.1 hypothetical protein An15g07170 [Aspergillus niger]PYH51658.1 hypothetical protein BO96DRAFT_349399 [Aspergillus niger CBS 101883]CAK48552.1 hypothetical protein An15g07170 [Aspergillus niger]
MKSGRRPPSLALCGAEVNITFRPTSLCRLLEPVVPFDSRSRFASQYVWGMSPGTVDPPILTITRLSSHPPPSVPIMIPSVTHGIGDRQCLRRAGDCARVIKCRVRLNRLDSRDKGSNRCTIGGRVKSNQKMTADFSRPRVSPCDP